MWAEVRPRAESEGEAAAIAAAAPAVIAAGAAKNTKSRHPIPPNPTIPAHLQRTP